MAEKKDKSVLYALITSAVLTGSFFVYREVTDENKKGKGMSWRKRLSNFLKKGDK